MQQRDLRRLNPLLNLLADGRFHSGQELGRVLGISRTAVWNRLRALRELDLELQAVSGKGYRLGRPLEPLRHELILSQLDQVSQALLTEMEILTRVDSTNHYLMSRGKSGAACLAEYQQEGRGRRGRSWHSPYGAGICLSLSWQFDNCRSTLSALGLAAGVWIVEALQAAGVGGLGLKWPNDVLHGGKKLAGILIEIRGETEGPCLAVIGVGLNVDMPERAASSIGQPWTDIRTITGRQPERNRIAGLLLHHLLKGLANYRQQGLTTVLERWNRLDCLANRPVQLQLPRETVTGTAHGVDETGALRLHCKEGVRLIHSGEVTLRPET